MSQMWSSKYMPFIQFGVNGSLGMLKQGLLHWLYLDISERGRRLYRHSPEVGRLKANPRGTPMRTPVPRFAELGYGT